MSTENEFWQLVVTIETTPAFPGAFKQFEEKVLAAYASGKETLRALSERFEVSNGSVLQRRRLSAIDTRQVRRLVRNKHDILLRELQEEMLKTVTCSQKT